jgi:TP901 family phage tail tape measure protein
MAGIGQALADLFIRVRTDPSGLKDGLSEVQKSLNVASSGFLSVGAQLSAGVTAPIIAAGSAMFGAANSIDEALDAIRTGTGQTGAVLEGLGDDFRAVFSEIPASSEAVATAISELNTRTGLTGESLRDLASVELELARLQGTDVASTIANTTRLFGDWAIATDQQASTLDRLFRVSQATGPSVETLSSLLVQFGAPLRQMGFSLEEASVLLGKFEKEGVNTELVVGSLRLALGQLARAGIEPVDGFRQLVRQIQTAETTAEATGLAMKLFGSRAGPDMAAAIREGRFSVDELMRTVAGGKETILGAAEDAKSFGENWQITKNKLQLALEPLGNRLLKVLEQLQPVMLRVIGFVAGIGEKFSNLDPRVQTIIVGMVGLAAAMGPVLAVVGSVLAGIAALAPAFGVLAAVVGSPLLVPVAAVVAVLGALAAAFVVAWKKSETFREVVIKLFEPMRQGAELAGKLAKALLGILSAKEAVAQGQEIEIIPESTISKIQGTPDDAAEGVEDLSAALDGLEIEGEEAALGLDKVSGAAATVRDRVKELTDGLRGQQMELNLSERELLEWELTTAGASEKQKQLALDLYDTNQSLAENKRWADEVARAQAAWNLQKNETLTRLDLEIAALKGNTDALRIWELQQQGATLADARAIIEKEKKIAAIHADREASIELGREVERVIAQIEAEQKRFEQSTLSILDSLSGGFFGRLKGLYGDLQTVTQKVFGGTGSGLLSSVGGFATNLLKMAGPAGAIFGAVDSIGKLFGIDLTAAVQKALSAIGGKIGEFFSSLGDAFGIGGHSPLSAKEFELFGFDVQKTDPGKEFTDSFQNADAKIKALSEDWRMSFSDVVKAWDDGIIELGLSAEGVQEDWRAIAEAAKDLVEAGLSPEEFEKFFHEVVDASAPLDEQVQRFIEGLDDWRAGLEETAAAADDVAEALGGAFEGLLQFGLETDALGVAQAAALRDAFANAVSEVEKADVFERLKEAVLKTPFEQLLDQALDAGAVSIEKARELWDQFLSADSTDVMRKMLKDLQDAMKKFADEAESSTTAASEAFEGLGEDLGDSLEGTGQEAEDLSDTVTVAVGDTQAAIDSVDPDPIAELGRESVTTGQRIRTMTAVVNLTPEAMTSLATSAEEARGKLALLADEGFHGVIVKAQELRVAVVDEMRGMKDDTIEAVESMFVMLEELFLEGEKVLTEIADRIGDAIADGIGGDGASGPVGRTRLSDRAVGAGSMPPIDIGSRVGVGGVGGRGGIGMRGGAIVVPVTMVLDGRVIGTAVGSRMMEQVYTDLGLIFQNK